VGIRALFEIRLWPCLRKHKAMVDVQAASHWLAINLQSAAAPTYRSNFSKNRGSSASPTWLYAVMSACRGRFAPLPIGENEVATRFKVGDHVTWNSEAGQVSGRIIKVHSKDVDYKGHTHHASQDEPQYEIKSDKTDHIAMHKGSALKKLSSR
jgi:hypothetical protein